MGVRHPSSFAIIGPSVHPPVKLILYLKPWSILTPLCLRMYVSSISVEYFTSYLSLSLAQDPISVKLDYKYESCATKRFAKFPCDSPHKDLKFIFKKKWLNFNTVVNVKLKRCKYIGNMSSYGATERTLGLNVTIDYYNRSYLGSRI